MTTPIHPDIPPQKFSCSTFLEEVPLNLADTPEGADYIGYYCGIECYVEFTELSKDEISSSPVSQQGNQK